MKDDSIFGEKIGQTGLPMVEMSRIGDEGTYSFWVYSEPLMHKSFHLRKKGEFEIVLTLDYDVLEIKFNNSKFRFQKNSPPPGEILKTVKSFMAANNKKQPKLTNLEAFELLWAANNE